MAENVRPPRPVRAGQPTAHRGPFPRSGRWGLAALLLLGAILPASSSAVTTSGVTDYVYGNGGTDNRGTADKPQSKLWFHDGSWWGGLFRPTPDDWRINKLVGDTWSDTGVSVDNRNRSHADYLSDGSKLYVASAHPGTVDEPDGELRFYRFSYAAGDYALDPGFPTTITTGGQVTATVAHDSAGDLWVAWSSTATADAGKMLLARSTDDGATWSAPFQLPVQSTLARAGDIPAVISFTDTGGAAVGVIWASGQPGSSGVWFAVHRVGSGDPTLEASWSSETLYTGSEAGDDHLNIKALSTGRLLVVTKTGKDGNPDPTLDSINLFDRDPDTGTWNGHVVGTVGDDHTRPQLALSEELGTVYVFLTRPNGGGEVFLKAASLADLDVEAAGGDPAFKPGVGLAVISDTVSTRMDDPTTTKQIVTGTSDLVVEASDRLTKTYFRATIGLAASDTTGPTGTVAINGGAAATMSTAVTLALAATDAGSGVAQVRVSDSSTTSGGVLSTGTTYAATASLPWTLTSGEGTKTVYAQFRDAAGNWSGVVSDTILLDTSAPTSGAAVINGGAATTTTRDVSVLATAVDAGSGMANVRVSSSATTSGGVLSTGTTFAYTGAAIPWTLTTGDGTKTVYAQFQDAAGNWSSVVSDTILLDTSAPKPVPWTRLSGPDRFATAAAISKATFPTPGVPVAYIATGLNFPDALAGSVPAARLGGPILLVRADAIPAATSAELARLKPAKIVVLGGSGVVSNAVATAAAQLSTTKTWTRLSGPDRFATAAAISKATFPTPGVPVAYIATGLNFPDALAGSVPAARLGGPILLVRADAIPAATSAELARLKPAKIVVLGGSGVVSNAVATAAAAIAGGVP